MNAEFKLDGLSNEDYQAAQNVNNQLAECHTREELNLLLTTSFFSLLDFSGAFYTRFEGENTTPQLLGNTNSTTLCQCKWQDFYEITLQNQLHENSLTVEQSSLLATEAFCCIGKACVDCSIGLNGNNNCEYQHCAFIVLFDSYHPTVALYFFRISLDIQLYNKRDIVLLQLLRATLLQTFNAILYKEECCNLQQVLDFMPDHDELLAVVNIEGKVVYKNQAFEQAVGKENCSKLLTRLTMNTSEKTNDTGNDCYLIKLDNRLYEVTITTISLPNKDDNELMVMCLSRVTDEKLNLNRKLHQAGLSSRELEIAVLIIQGISTHNVSDQLNLSYHTIRNHLKHIYSKLGVSTRSEMLTWDGS